MSLCSLVLFQRIWFCSYDWLVKTKRDKENRTKVSLTMETITITPSSATITSDWTIQDHVESWSQGPGDTITESIAGGRRWSELYETERMVFLEFYAHIHNNLKVMPGNDDFIPEWATEPSNRALDLLESDISLGPRGQITDGQWNATIDWLEEEIDDSDDSDDSDSSDDDSEDDESSEDDEEELITWSSIESN